MLRPKHIPVWNKPVALTLIFFAAIVASHGSVAQSNETVVVGTSPGINLINFDNLSSKQDNEPLVYDLGNGRHCAITIGIGGNCSEEITGFSNVTEAKDGKALQLSYDLGECNNSWTQIVFTFEPSIDLSDYDHLIIDWRGDQTANTLEVGMTDTEARHASYGHVTQKSWWGPLVIPFKYIGSGLDLKKVKTIFISVTNIPDNKDEGGIGSITIDNLRLLNISARKTPLDFEIAKPDINASKAAAEWLSSQQNSTGLLKSWEEENAPLAHLYDQALALIVFSQEDDLSKNATQLVEALVELQNEDGSWYQTYNFSSMKNATTDKWIGDVAWAVYALNRYTELVGESNEAKMAVEKGTRWLQNQTNPSSGCLENKSVEAAIDTWWALQASGKANESNNLRKCVLASYWDGDGGRFLAGEGDWKPVSDVQTWGAAILKATGEKENALRALSYAREVLLVSSQDQKVTALGDQAGLWSVSNECTGQYIVAGGEGSNQMLQELISQQRDDGAMPGSPDSFEGAGAWNTQWHGVAPTAWLYFASSSGPFNLSKTPT